ncbi:MAG: hypothetical protein RIE24_25285 [Silicimonas sp.]
MSATQDMIGLLEEEYRILTRGDLAALSDLVARKEILESRLRNDEPDAEALRILAGSAIRNDALVDATQRGLDQARVLIREIREGLTQATYSQNGVRRTLSRNPGRFEQKL